MLFSRRPQVWLMVRLELRRNSNRNLLLEASAIVLVATDLNVPFQMKTYNNYQQLLHYSSSQIDSLSASSASILPFQFRMDFRSFHGLLTRWRHTFPFERHENAVKIKREAGGRNKKSCCQFFGWLMKQKFPRGNFFYISRDATQDRGWKWWARLMKAAFLHAEISKLANRQTSWV